MQQPLPIREAHRVFLVVQLAKLILTLISAVIIAGMGFSLVSQLLLMALGPMAVVLMLLLLPIFRRLFGQYYLAAALLFDLTSTSLRAMPLVFNSDRIITVLGFSAPHVQQWLDVSLIEPFLMILVPLVLMAWAYGRKGALWASALASVLHIGEGMWAMQGDFWTVPYMLREAVRVVLLCVVPLIVSVLANRERRHIDDLQAAHDRLQRYAAAVEQLTASRERNRLARDLHDTLAHSLAALTVQLQALRTLLIHDPVRAEGALDEAIAVAQRGLQESRQAIQALRVDPVETLGLATAIETELRTFEGRTGIHGELRLAGQEDVLTAEESQVLWRIVEEALANIERHAAADHVTVRLGLGADRVDLEIADNGVGFDADAVPEDRFGLLGMRERAAMIGAELDVSSAPGAGTHVWLTLAR
jgi:signal transduction histidine kinase